MLAEDHWYFVGSDRRRYGPYSLGVLRGYIRSGHVADRTLVWEPTFGSEWRAAGEVEGLFVRAAPAPLQPPIPQPLTPPGMPQPLVPPGMMTPGGRPMPQPVTYGGVAPAAAVQIHPHVRSYMGFAIVSMAALFLPAGVVGVMYASKVDGLARSGRLPEARDNARKARRWCILACVIGGGQLVISLIFLFIIAATT